MSISLVLRLAGGPLALALLAGCTPEFYNGFARGLANSQGAWAPQAGARPAQSVHLCPADDSQMYFTGKSQSEFGSLMLLYRCPMGHEYWVNSAPRVLSPAVANPCPVCGGGTWFTGRTQFQMGKLLKIYQCPAGHESVRGD